MVDGTIALYATAASVAFVHTALGPDHYLPFVAMSRAGGWSRRKTIVVTLLCGLGHVLSSAILALICIALGIAALEIEWLERFRGDIAGWLLLSFGLVYFLWGVRRAIRNQPHTHFHAHADGVVHTHEHTHHAEHVHVHARDRDGADRTGFTPWVLFTIFLFGPCEPLIPIFMYAAAKGTMWTVVGVSIVFGVFTIATMLAIVACSSWIVGITPLLRGHRYGHALAGLAVLACGVAVRAGL